MGTGEGAEITKKGDLIVGKIIMGRGPISLVPVNAGIVPIPKSRVDTRTDHVHVSMLIGVRNPQRTNDPTMPLWML